MHSFIALVKKDLRGYFDQPAGYVILGVFVGVVSFLYFETLDESREASLRPLFNIMILPWILPVFVAFSTMRLMAEEQRDGTLEVLLTQPIRAWTVLFAKYVAGLAFVGTGILFTIGIPIAVQTAGDLDGGAIIAQYVGTFSLMASFVAMGLFGSSLTRNQIVAAMIALVLIVGLSLAGQRVVTLALPTGIGVLVQDLSPMTHYTSMARGILDLRDVVYFLALVSVFLSGTYLMIRGKSVSHRSPLYRNLQLGVAALVVISVLVGWFGGSINGRWDLTEKKLHTFSEATEELLGGLDDLVTIKLFASDNLPPRAALVRRDLNDFVDAIADLSDGKVRVVRRNTDPEDEDSVRAAQENLIRPVQISTQSETKLGFLGMSITYVNQREVIPVIRTTDGLEYTVASAIFRMVQRDPKIVGFFSNSEDPEAQFQQDGVQDFRTFRAALEEQVQIDEIRESRDGLLQLGGVDVLIVTGPGRQISATTTAEIDTHLAEGGQALFLLDPVQVNIQQLKGEANEFSLASYLAQYGIAVQSDLVFDVRSYEPINVPDVFDTIIIPYPYWVRIPETDPQISSAVKSVVFPWPSSLRIIEPTETTVDVEEVIALIQTTRFAAIDEDFQNLAPRSPHLEEVAEESQGQRLLAVAVTGTRCPPGEPECDKDLSDKHFRIIVATDSDWINEGWANQSPGHVEMAVNWVDWLTQGDALASIRAKGVSARTLLYSSPTHRTLVKYANVVGVPVLFIVLGLVRYVMRRRVTRKAYTREK